jgi:hypothetical protein
MVSPAHFKGKSATDSYPSPLLHDRLDLGSHRTGTNYSRGTMKTRSAAGAPLTFTGVRFKLIYTKARLSAR